MTLRCPVTERNVYLLLLVMIHRAFYRIEALIATITREICGNRSESVFFFLLWLITVKNTLTFSPEIHLTVSSGIDPRITPMTFCAVLNLSQWRILQRPSPDRKLNYELPGEIFHDIKCFLDHSNLFCAVFCELQPFRAVKAGLVQAVSSFHHLAAQHHLHQPVTCSAE